MDIITATVLLVIVLVLVAPIIEIAAKRPKTFLEMEADTRAFAEAPLDDSVGTQSSAGVSKVADAPAVDDRLAGITS